MCHSFYQLLTAFVLRQILSVKIVCPKSSVKCSLSPVPSVRASPCSLLVLASVNPSPSPSPRPGLVLVYPPSGLDSLLAIYELKESLSSRWHTNLLQGSSTQPPSIPLFLSLSLPSFQGAGFRRVALLYSTNMSGR